LTRDLHLPAEVIVMRQVMALLALVLVWASSAASQTAGMAGVMGWSAVPGGHVGGEDLRGSARSQNSGTYSFRLELGAHVLARYSAGASCKRPENSHCEHSGQLYLYPEGEIASLKAIYFEMGGTSSITPLGRREPAWWNCCRMAVSRGRNFGSGTS
jgi:hypothetical protein